MNGFEVYKKFKKSKKKLDYKAEDLYLFLLANQNRTVNNIFLNTLTDKHNKEIYLQAQILFNLRENFFKKLFNKGIIRSDSDQSDIVRQEYEESIAERTKLRKQRLDEIKRKEQNINNELFKKYFTDYQSPSNMYKKLSETEGAVNKVRVDSIKKVLSKLQRTIDYVPKDNAFKIQENEKIIDIVERILEFNQLNQSGQGLKILTSNQMLSRLPISLAQLKAGNNSEKLKNEIRQLLYSLYRSKKLTKRICKSLVDII